MKEIVLANPTGSANGSGLKLMCDLEGAGKVKNIEIIDGGKGYVAGEALTFTHANLDTDDLIVQAAVNFKRWNSANNFWVDTAGAGYVQDTVYGVTNPANGDLAFNIKATGVNAGALTTCTLASVEDNNNLSLSPDYNTPYDVAGGGKIYMIKENLIITNAAGDKAFVVGDVVVDHATASNIAIVTAIDGDDRPTGLNVISGSFADGARLDKQGDDTTYCTLTAITTDADARTTWETNGLGLDPIFNFNNNNESQGKVNVDTANVFLTTDLISTKMARWSVI